MLKKTSAVPWISATAYRCGSVRLPKAQATGTEPNARRRAASQASMTTLRLQRSRSAPAGRPRMTKGICWAAPINPAWTADPVSASTSSGSASREMPLPTVEITCPAHSRRKSALRQRDKRSESTRCYAVLSPGLDGEAGGGQRGAGLPVLGGAEDGRALSRRMAVEHLYFGAAFADRRPDHVGRDGERLVW